MKGIRVLVLLAGGLRRYGSVGRRVREIRRIEPIPAFTPDQLTAEPTDNWSTARGDIYNRQFSGRRRDHQGQRVKEPQGRLAHARGDPDEGQAELHGGSFAEAEPVVYDGTMYMPDTKGNVFAFDAVTGERLWYYKPTYPKGFASALPISRGVVIGDGKVFMAQTDGSGRRSRPGDRPRRLEDEGRRLQAGVLLHRARRPTSTAC